MLPTSPAPRPSPSRRPRGAPAFLVVLGLALAATAPAQSPNFCETFDNCLMNGWGALAASPNVGFNVPAGGPSGSGCYLRATDQSGGSAIAASSATVAAWNAAAGCGTFCWDYQIEFDGNFSANPPITHAITIVGTNGLSFRFVATNPIFESGPNAGWTRFCAPIAGLDSGGALPSNATGAWVPTPPATAADWPAVSTSVANIVFPVDFTGNPAEIVGIDNVCVTGCRTGVNKDLRNGTGQTATGVEILVEGVFASVTSHFDGSFTNFTIVPAGSNTRFVWTGGSVAAGAVDHVGVEVEAASLKILGVFWTDAFGVIGCAPQCNALYGTHSSGGLVTYTNDVTVCSSTTKYVGNRTIEFYSEAPSLASLNPTGLALGLRTPLSIVPYGPANSTAVPVGAARTDAVPTAPAGANWAVLVFDVGDAAALPGTGGTTDFIMVPVTPVPARDECASAQPISVGTTIGDNLLATTSATTGSCGSMAADVWFEVSVPCPSMTIDTCGSPFDTVIAVFDACGGLQLGCNDDEGSGPCPGTLTSRLALNGLTVGSTLKIAVGGFNGARGTFSLNVAAAPSLALTHDVSTFTFFLQNCGGTPGNVVLNALTLSQGNYPSGWFYGVDIPIFEIFNLLQTGPPFLVLLDGLGGYQIAIPGIPPLGVTFYAVAVEYSPAGIYVNRSAPTSLLL